MECKSLKILISAGEISGDVHGANLVSEIKKLNPGIVFFGMGHQKMAQAGVDIRFDLAMVSTIGFVEPIRHSLQILRAYFGMKKLLKTERPDVLIVIDYQGFHMVLAKAAKKLGVSVIYYIAPQEWQWGTEKGGRAVVANVDKILSIFPEEADFYNRLGGNAVYVGNPVLDSAQSDVSKDTTKRIVSVFPGSRPQELSRTFPLLLEAVRLLHAQVPGLHFFLSIASPKLADTIKAKVHEFGLETIITYYTGNQYDLIANTDLSLATSGTITLEHAVLGTPCIANYRFGRFSFWLAKKILGARLKRIGFMALPNILAKRKIMPEFLQDACTPGAIAKEAEFLLTHPNALLEIRENFAQVKEKLGEPGVVARAAAEVISFLDQAA